MPTDSKTSSRSRFMRGLAALRGVASPGLAALLIVGGFVLGYELSGGGGPDRTERADRASSPAAANAQAYTCSMHPNVRMPHPDDKCPICGMGLVPVGSADAAGSGTKTDPGPRAIRLTPTARASLEIETTPVTRRFIRHRVDLVGKIEYDETRLSYLTAYVGGRLDRLFVDYTGIEVQEGDHLAEIYSPKLLVAREELRAAKRSFDRQRRDQYSMGDAIALEAARSVLDAARERLRLLGLTDSQIAAIEAGQASGDHVTLYAPIGGVVIEKNARRGSYVEEGDRIFTIADLSKVWVIFEAYESDLPWLRYGQRVTFRTEAFGEERFEGRIAFIDPTFSTERRTVRVRVNASNAEGRLRPGMFVRGHVEAEVAAGGRVIAPDYSGKWISPMHPEIVRDQPGQCPVCGMDLVKAESLGYASASSAQAQAPLVVPESAVLRTGKRAVVYVRRPESESEAESESESESEAAGSGGLSGGMSGLVFEGREVELGPHGAGFFLVRSGLREGELVATQGAFQIDSELQIQAKRSMMNPAGPAEGEAGREAGGGSSGGRTPLSGSAAEAMRAWVEAYLALVSALAEDDRDAAQARAVAVDRRLQEASEARFPDPFASAWRERERALRSAGRRLREAEALSALREAFEPLSEGLIELLERAAIKGVGRLHRVFCPMAFDDRGASWVADSMRVRNPYFGAAMLECGQIVQTLHAPRASDPGRSPAPDDAPRAKGPEPDVGTDKPDQAKREKPQKQTNIPARRADQADAPGREARPSRTPR